MSAYVTATVKVKNQEKLKQYIAAVPATIAAHGGEMISRGKVSKVLAGAADYQICAAFRFPTMEVLEGWYNSPEYQELIALRDEGAEVNIIALNEF
jgi:uncharacterized protein (DUF1330 family)